jgi:hypothetical protein
LTEIYTFTSLISLKIFNQPGFIGKNFFKSNLQSNEITKGDIQIAYLGSLHLITGAIEEVDIVQTGLSQIILSNNFLQVSALVCTIVGNNDLICMLSSNFKTFFVS